MSDTGGGMSTGGRVRYITTGVVFAIVLTVLTIVGRGVLGEQATELRTAEVTDIGAPIMTVPEMAGALLIISAGAVGMALVRRYQYRGDRR